MHRFDELPDEPVEFNLPYGEWIRLFREHGFRVEALVEVRPPEDAETTYRTADETAWARSVADGGDLAPDHPQHDRAQPGRARQAFGGRADRPRRRQPRGLGQGGRGYVAGAERNWAADEITWGILDVPESEVEILGDVEGKDVVELGCGTAYVSAWLARRGARVVGVDLTEEQLETARRMQAKHGLEFPLVHASAEDVPLPDASFDLAVSEYGASSGATPTSGSRRRRGCSGRAASSCSSSTGRC